MYLKYTVLKSEASLHLRKNFPSPFIPYFFNIYFFQELISQILVINSTIINVMPQMTSTPPSYDRNHIAALSILSSWEHTSLQNVWVQTLAVHPVSSQWLLESEGGQRANSPSKHKWPACSLRLCLLITNKGVLKHSLRYLQWFLNYFKELWHICIELAKCQW